MNELERAILALRVFYGQYERTNGIAPSVRDDNRVVAVALGVEPLGWDEAEEAELDRIWELEQTGLDPPAIAALHIDALRRQGYLT